MSDTAEIVKKYLESGYSRCPYPDCLSQDIEGGFVEVDANGAHQECSCNTCGRSWTDQYRLVGVKLDDPVK